MSTSKKYLIWAAVALVAFIIVICYASEIQVWLMSRITSIIIIAVAFCVGWLLGRFAGRSNDTDEQRK